MGAKYLIGLVDEHLLDLRMKVRLGLLDEDQMQRLDRYRAVADQLLAEGKAYEDEGAIRFRMPDEGTVAWDDAVRGRIEFENANLADLVIVRSDGRPTYNFVNPVDDMLDGITHVIRGEDHVSNTPTQINILRALGADLPVYAHVPNIHGEDGKKLSKRHGAVSVDVFRAEGYHAPALMNFLALLGWSYDDRTTLMRRDELIERFALERVVPSPATFDYKKLDWMNGVYLRELPAERLYHGAHRPRGGPRGMAPVPVVASITWDCCCPLRCIACYCRNRWLQTGGFILVWAMPFR